MKTDLIMWTIANAVFQSYFLKKESPVVTTGVSFFILLSHKKAA